MDAEDRYLLIRCRARGRTVNTQSPYMTARLESLIRRDLMARDEHGDYVLTQAGLQVLDERAQAC